jgi:hypothetical protein
MAARKQCRLDQPNQSDRHVPGSRRLDSVAPAIGGSRMINDWAPDLGGLLMFLGGLFLLAAILWLNFWVIRNTTDIRDR